MDDGKEDQVEKEKGSECYVVLLADNRIVKEILEATAILGDTYSATTCNEDHHSLAHHHNTAQI